ncbi:MAG: GDP-L-fucose synthase [Defluviitaleaceae bacterium]|nr:GDP-L-fucose synthase [Defluviitaleaceae bacterium]
MQKSSKIYVAGHRGMVGTALTKRLAADGYTNIITRTHSQLDLTRQADVENFFATEKPEYVFLLAAQQGGIAYNRDFPADALIINSLIELNVIKAAHENAAKRLIFTSSSTVYPEVAPQPMSEDLFLTGALEKSLGGFALAKSLGMRICEYLGKQYGTKFTSIIVPNLYGENDKGTTVLPMLIQKFKNAVATNAETVEVWGTGNARRELLHAADVADAMLFINENFTEPTHINAGYGTDISIRELAELLKKISGFNGEIFFDTTKPEGTMQKLLDSTKLFGLGWRPTQTIEQGIASVYHSYQLKS